MTLGAFAEVEEIIHSFPCRLVLLFRCTHSEIHGQMQLWEYIFAQAISILDPHFITERGFAGSGGTSASTGWYACTTQFVPEFYSSSLHRETRSNMLNT